jgi:spore germination protein KB
LDKYRVSGYQIILVILFSTFSTAVFWVPSEAASFVNQDAWIAVLLATVISIPLIYLPIASLAKKYPYQTVIEYSNDILGKVLGKFVGLLFIYFFFQNHCWALRTYGEIATIFMTGTPILAFLISLSLITVLVVKYGVEVIIRCAEIIFPVGLFLLIMIVVFVLDRVEISNLLPIMETKMGPLILATLSPFDWMGVGFITTVFLAYINRPASITRVCIIGIGLGGILLTFFSVIVISVLGSKMTTISNFPVLGLARYSGIPGLFERIEALVIPVWTAALFVRIALFSYGTVVGLAQLFKLSDYRFLVIPETIFAIAYSLFQYDSFVEIANIWSQAHIYYIIFWSGLPIFLWLVSLIRYKMSKR